jgi:histidyl-tRNA synthetase
MATKIPPVKGMHPMLPPETDYWAFCYNIFRNVCETYGYQEIILPIVEHTQLFERGVGSVTDIVEKELYTFEDRNGDSLSLRPEGTASCVRAGIDGGLFRGQIQRLWYIGPMFRHEKPQQGRTRSFHQLGIEAFGVASPDIDVEIIAMCDRIFRVTGLRQHVTLEINSLGSFTERAEYREKLVAYLQQHHDKLDEDSKRRLNTNPLRILDSKNPDMAQIITQAPTLLDNLSTKSARHFKYVTNALKKMGITYKINPRLVRGLDYYCNTVFEWCTDQLGAQGTICAGGRYDSLVEELGGNPTPAIGCSLGIERLMMLLAQEAQPDEFAVLPEIYVLATEQTFPTAVTYIERMRNLFPFMRFMYNIGGGNIKNQFKRADKSGAEIAFIFGDEEATRKALTVKHLRRADLEQLEIPYQDLEGFIKDVLLNENNIEEEE